MFVGISSWILNLFFLFALTYVVVRRFRTNQPSLDLATFVFIGILLTTFMMFMIGVSGNLRPLSILITSVVGLVLLFALPKTRRELAEFPSILGESKSALQTWWISLPRWLRWATVTLVAVLSFRFTFLAWALPPFVWDSLTYHLTNIAHWTQTGRIAVFETPVERIYLPANFEVFSTWFVVFLHHDAFVELAGIPAYLLAGASVYTSTQKLGVRAPAALLATITYLTVPAVLLAVTGTKNDPIMAALYLYAIALTLELGIADERVQTQSRPKLWVLWLVVLFYALGTKAYILHLAPGLFVLGLVAAITTKNVPRVLRDLKDFWFQVRSPMRSGGYILIGLLVLGGILGLYWNTRNYVLTGNPFYPFGVSVGSSQVLPTDFGSAKFSLGNFVDNVRVLGEKFGDKALPVLPDLPETTGWGWIIYSMGIPAMIWGLFRQLSVRMIATGFLASLIMLYLSSPTSPWNMRYVIWFPAIFAISIGVVSDKLPIRFRKIQISFAGLFWLCVALNVSMVAAYTRISIEAIQEMLSYPLAERESALLDLNTPAEYANTLTFVPDDKLLGYNVTHNGFVYPLFRNDFSQRVVFVPLMPRADCQVIANTMRELGTRYLFVAPEHSEDILIATLRNCSDSDTEIREGIRGIYVLK